MVILLNRCSSDASSSANYVPFLSQYLWQLATAVTRGKSMDWIGLWCKKYPSIELRGLFQYLVNQLKKGSGIELVLLQELIQQMANVQYTENMTEEQLDAMAGSETLRYQATSFGATRNNKALIKSTNRLRDSLLPKNEPKLAIPLLLLIAQHRAV
ncbi:hypothetical protein LXL04_028865 [Taraxacum kok-saghyz]